MKYANLLLAALAAPIQAAFTWKNVKIGGGGGFVPSIVFHPTTKGVAYARTDIGGLYRLNADDSWTPVTDANSFADDSHWNRWGVDALALDPQDANKVFIAVGMYTNSWDPNNGQIARSSDKGATWSFTDLPFKVGGNMPGRGNGERLAVDPKNSNIIYFGARSGNGLYKSTNGGTSFSKVSSFTAVGTFRAGPADNEYSGDIQGINFVTFDSTSAALSGATSRIFVGVAENTTSSVYVSNDAGSTWSAVAGQPGKYFPHKGRIQPTEKALYLTYSDGTGPYDGTSGSVWRYDLTANTWKDITPVAPGSDLYFGFGGLGLDMQKPGTLVVATLNSWWPDAQLFRSTDSGATWKKIWTWGTDGNQNFSYVQTSPKAPWIKTNFLDVDTKDLGWMIESLEIDPLDSNHWLWGTGLTIFGGHDLTNWDTGAKVNIQSLADGIEEMSIQELASAPGGSELLVANYDNNGFTFKAKSNLDTSPQTTWTNPMWASSVGVDYAGNKVANVVRVGNTAGTQQLAVSSDGGATWNINYAAGTTQYGGTVAYSADADTILWSTATLGVQRSQNQGSLAVVSSIPAGAIIASDKKNNTVFYGASGSSFYRSTNLGATFATSGSFGSASEIRHVEAHPAKAGDVWVSTNVGIFHSTDYGVTFTQVSTVLTNTNKIALGKGSGTNWNLYAFGTGSAGRRLYGSADLGASWTDLQGTQSFGAIDSAKLAGSGNEENLVYVGANGRGAFYASGAIASSGGGSTSAAQTSTSRASSSTAAVTSSTSSARSSTLTTSTTVRTSTSSAPAATATNLAPQYGQCGGQGWTGPTQCVSPYICTVSNQYYSQCL
ncbi:fungal cellulose binding domain-containing protein [Colletotrichum godetiae]|uniref:Fungal cellulose binding domain-containing protein n=1 Tax=Colletotrichum godetiae TaxID=1209918 RepID=A0AAJ0AJV6_9PEZI|nr:fungal cellulose binding domain-containing protein [Colletotrichum godetiae]KAK1675210.1 fungal cellulose binding domain-containing protein [Colletotrichum godetiae]